MIDQLILMLRVTFEFFKIGLFAVGGGPATIPFLFDLGARTGWFTNQELTNMLAISESTPGPVGVNMATYVGFKTLGFFGGLISTFGLVLPSVVVIVLIAKFMANFSDNPRVKKAFWGIRPAVTALIGSAVYAIWHASLLRETASGYEPIWGSIIICFLALGLMRIKKLQKMHPAMWLLGAAIIGVVFRL